MFNINVMLSHTAREINVLELKQNKVEILDFLPLFVWFWTWLDKNKLLVAPVKKKHFAWFHSKIKSFPHPTLAHNHANASSVLHENSH